MTRLATLLGTASLLAMAGMTTGHAQSQVAIDSDEPPETVLITGSLIRGTTAVGAPVTNFTPQDFATTGALITADLFRFFPAASVQPGAVATNVGSNIERGIRVSLRNLDTGTATRSLLMVDGIRFPAQGSGQCYVTLAISPRPLATAASPASPCGSARRSRSSRRSWSRLGTPWATSSRTRS